MRALYFKLREQFTILDNKIGNNHRAGIVRKPLAEWHGAQHEVDGVCAVEARWHARLAWCTGCTTIWDSARAVSVWYGERFTVDHTVASLEQRRHQRRFRLGWELEQAVEGVGTYDDVFKANQPLRARRWNVRKQAHRIAEHWPQLREWRPSERGEPEVLLRPWAPLPGGAILVPGGIVWRKAYYLEAKDAEAYR